MSLTIEKSPVILPRPNLEVPDWGGLQFIDLRMTENLVNPDL